MIIIKKSPTADTRTCDFANVSKETLLASSHQHIADVREGLRYFGSMLAKAAENHDYDKITDIDGFHRDFLTGFKQTDWWDKHRILNRHHLNMEDGVRDDVNLIDVLDFIVDCVMAGMARSDEVYPLLLPVGLLNKAFQNTVDHLKKNVMVLDPQTAQPVPEACAGSNASEHPLTQPDAEAAIAVRELIATMMLQHSFATGHGDTAADLLRELFAQIEERREAVRKLVEAARAVILQNGIHGSSTGALSEALKPFAKEPAAK